MKLQKLYAIILGLALISPQANLQATKVPASQGNFSWVGSTLGTLASFSAKTLTFPFTTLSFCYRNLFAGAVLAGVAYWGYKTQIQPRWVEYLKKRSTREAESVNLYSANPVGFTKLSQEEQNTHASTLQRTINSYLPWHKQILSLFPHRCLSWFGCTKDNSANNFFEQVKAAAATTINLRQDRTTQMLVDQSANDPLSQSQRSVLELIYYSNHPEDAVSNAYHRRAVSATLSNSLNGKDSVDLPLAGAVTQPKA